MTTRFFLILLTIISIATISQAAEVTLAWDPPEITDNNLIGYNLYYKAESSVQSNPDGANLIYIPISEVSFDPDQPSYTFTNLKDDTQYYFTVTAMVGDDESGMSNEVSAFKEAAPLDTDTDAPSNETGSTPSAASTGSKSGYGVGCFIISLQ